MMPILTPTPVQRRARAAQAAFKRGKDRGPWLNLLRQLAWQFGLLATAYGARQAYEAYVRSDGTTLAQSATPFAPDVSGLR